MSTYNATAMLHVEEGLGIIEVGKKADMVLLNEDPTKEIANTLKIHSVIKNGVIQKRIK